MMRAAVHTTLWLIAMAALLFLGAGDWHWPEAWLFLAEIAVTSAALEAWLLRHDPALLRERLSGTGHRDQTGWDKLFLPGMMIGFCGWMVLIALDARRFGWSAMPALLEALGAVLILASMAITWATFRVNTFAVPQVRVQRDRGQTVIDGGPYGLVRHPMYSGALLFFAGMPLMLGSWLGLAAAPVLAAIMGARAVGEERVLRRDLAGYDAYAARVRYRLLPGVW